MKRKSFVFILIILSLLVGCSLKTSDNKSSTDDWGLEKDKENLFAKVRTIGEDGKPSDLVQYLDRNMIRLRSDELTESLFILNTMQKKHLNEYNKLISKEEYSTILETYIDNKGEINYESNKDLEGTFADLGNDKLEKILIEAYGGNYRLVKNDGEYEFIIDYDTYDKYDSNALSEIKTYIAIQKEDQGFMDREDFSFDKLGNKLISIEEHLSTYKDGYGYEELLRMYSEDLRVLMEGSSKRPILTEDKKIKSDVLAAYKTIAGQDTITSEAIKDYLELIEEAEGNMTESVMDSILTIHNGVIASLEK